MSDCERIIKEIQSAYVGTAEQHKLLAELVDDFGKTFQLARESHEKELESIRDQLRQELAVASKLTKGRDLDHAIFNWLSNDRDKTNEDDWDWTLGYIVSAMKGRGLTAANVLLFYEKMRDREHAEAEREATEEIQSLTERLLP